MFFNIFLNYLDKVIEGILIKSDNDTELVGLQAHHKDFVIPE